MDNYLLDILYMNSFKEKCLMIKDISILNSKAFSIINSAIVHTYATHLRSCDGNISKYDDKPLISAQATDLTKRNEF